MFSENSIVAFPIWTETRASFAGIGTGGFNSTNVGEESTTFV
jgi:hypothetical protein